MAISAPAAADDGSGGAYLRVGTAPTLRWSTPGEMAAFDDSFEHQVWNDGPTPRYVFGVELRHPEIWEHSGWYQGSSGWADGVDGGRPATSG